MLPTCEEDFLLDTTTNDFQITQKQYGISDKMFQESLENIRHWYTMQPHLPKAGYDETRIIRILLYTGYSVEKTKHKIDNLLTARSIVPELLTERDPLSSRMRQALKMVDWIVLPKRTDDNARVTVFRLASEDPTDYDPWDCFKGGFMVADYRMCRDAATGDHFVCDLANIRGGHLIKITPTLAKKCMFVLQSCYGAKIKGIHLINAPPYAEIAIALFKSALSKKVVSRIVVHKGYETLQDYFSKKILPCDLGGEEVHSQKIADSWREALSSDPWRKWFIQQDSIQSNESKRLEKTSSLAEELLGMHGSFRSLDVD